MIHRVAFLSCTHVGARTGLMPEEFETQEGNILRPSEAQQQLLEYFADYWNHEAKTAEYVVFLGDMCNGPDFRNSGFGNIITGMNEQVKAAANLLRPFIRGRRLYGIEGSRYHQAKEMNMDHALVEKLGGKFLGQRADLKFGDKYIRIFHGVTPAWWYSAGWFEKMNLMLAKAEAARKFPYRIDAVVCGHWHKFRSLDIGYRTFVRVPSWELNISYDKISDKEDDVCIGGVVMDIGDQITVHPRTYPWIPTSDAVVKVV